MIPRIIVTLGLCTLTLGACREAQSTTQASSAVTAQDSVLVQVSDTTLVGKRLYLSFDGNSSVVEYLSPQHLYWFSKDSVHGEKEGRDYYNSLHIDDANVTNRIRTTMSCHLCIRQSAHTDNKKNANNDGHCFYILFIVQ